ncbi:MAG: hypothetical protein ABJM29_04115 [Rhizobiaceae bacterium]
MSKYTCGVELILWKCINSRTIIAPSDEFVCLVWQNMFGDWMLFHAAFVVATGQWALLRRSWRNKDAAPILDDAKAYPISTAL